MQYSLDKLIGKGAFGSVFAALWKNQNVALKIYDLDLKLSNSQKLLTNVVKELLELDHPNIVKCFGLCQEKGAIFLELAEKKICYNFVIISVHSLKQLISVVGSSGTISEWLLLTSMFEIAQGLNYLHSQNITHGDLKCANFLVSGTEDAE